jgi:hypothetical protein
MTTLSAGMPPPAGERPAAGLQGVPGEAALVPVVSVAMGREVGAAEDVADGLFDALAAGAAKESEDIFLDLLSCHVLSLV